MAGALSIMMALFLGTGSVLGAKDAVSGPIVGWGWNDTRQATPPTGDDYVAVSAGGLHSLALKSDGSVVGWGNSLFGLPVMPGGNDYIAVSAGFTHSLALKSDGSIVGWGDDSYGQAVPPTGNDFSAVSAGGFHSLALKSDGSIVGWGSNSYGQSTPPAGNDYVAVSAGFTHSLAMKRDGSIVGWGDNTYGQITIPAADSYSAIAAGYGHSLALKGDPPKPVLEIRQPPQSYTVAPGSSATFTVLTGGFPGETFQWKFGDTTVGNDSSTLTLLNVQAAQSGQYTVTVTAGGNSVTSRSVTLGIKAPPYDTERLMNISTRGQILTGTKIMIAGFVLEGAGQKDVLIRGIGPTLGQWVNGVCTDPKLELFRNTNPATPSIAANEKWGLRSEDISGICQRVGAFPFQDGSVDAAIFMALEPGAYTAKVSGLDGTGVGLVELYDADLDPLISICNLSNISTRGEVGTGSKILIAGFVIAGDVPKQVLVRGIGPRLADFNVDGTLSDPYLRIYKNAKPEALWVASNDNWSDHPDAVDIAATAAAVGAFGLIQGSKDASVLTWLEPGTYTVQVSGVDDGTGVALVEVYEVN